MRHGVKRPPALTPRIAALSLILTVPVLGGWSGGSAGPPAPTAPVVVELFTSQGCSSCPPADALLGELAGRQNVIALAFHVDYWDNIGWRDPYSTPEATLRQRRYVESLRLSSAFTPQVVIGGRRSLVGSDRQGIEDATSQGGAPGVRVEAAVIQNELVVSLPDGSDRRDHDVTLVAYLPQATTRVGRGENSGRTLVDFNIVRYFRRLGAWSGKAGTWRVRLDSLPRDATRVAVLVQEANQGAIAGAAAIDLGPRFSDGCDACVARVTRDGHPGLARSRDCAAQCASTP
jgi:hypothetical protein